MEECNGRAKRNESQSEWKGRTLSRLIDSSRKDERWTKLQAKRARTKSKQTKSFGPRISPCIVFPLPCAGYFGATSPPLWRWCGERPHDWWGLVTMASHLGGAGVGSFAEP